jgi:prepilin-type N-terminal cleavage/methylation domain-containing protein
MLGAAISKRERGFTLVELSIVLTIAALFLGGAFVGARALKASAQQKAAMSQAVELRTVVAAFRERFKYLPGDFIVNDEIEDLSEACKKGGQPNGDGMISLQESPCAVEHIVHSGLAPLDSFSTKASGEVVIMARAAAESRFTSQTGAAVASPISKRVSNVILFGNISCEAAKAIDSALDDGDLTTRQVVALGGACQDETMVWLAVPVS